MVTACKTEMEIKADNSIACCPPWPTTRPTNGRYFCTYPVCVSVALFTHVSCVYRLHQ